MAPHAPAFFALSCLALLTLVLIFGMKYFSAARAGGGRASLAALQVDMAETKSRLAAIETLLKDVG